MERRELIERGKKIEKEGQGEDGRRENTKCEKGWKENGERN